jgi:hypothetical protein
MGYRSLKARQRHPPHLAEIKAYKSGMGAFVTRYEDRIVNADLVAKQDML